MEYYFTAQKLAVGYDNRPLIENIDFSLKKGRDSHINRAKRCR